MTTTVSTTTTLPSFLALNVAGHDLILLRTQVKPREGDRELKYYYCFRKADQRSVRRGTEFKALADELPTQLTIDGKSITLARGKTAASYKENGQEVTVPEEERRPAVFVDEFQHFPSLEDEERGDTGLRHVEVLISQRQNGNWNVKIVVNRVGLNSVSPEESKERAARRADSDLADMKALMASFGL